MTDYKAKAKEFASEHATVPTSMLAIPGALGLAVSIWAHRNAFGDGSQRPCDNKKNFLRVAEALFAIMLLVGLYYGARKYRPELP